ncbi:DUF4184 family protein [Flammeovirga pectinis]|uniref:DUF4184 family protein n=1 Tax=Flammeovirga pectinis TaxID=2494373 RepID=A0A3Q9FKQ8_9BACT|nr:DUF4184 family protein [Flammeovirga pectinis]AZQ61938.1 DUF4184 family protein [Flammeovirga pectinis]
MPITFAHPSAILPLIRYHHVLSISAMVIGSMIPDFEHFFIMEPSAKVGHSLLGILTFDLPIGILVYYITKYLFKPILNKVSPIRFKVDFRGNKYPFWAILVSLLIGIGSHFLLDAITGEEGYFVKDLPFLFKEIQLTETIEMNVHLFIWLFISFFGLAHLVWLGLVYFDLSATIQSFKDFSLWPLFMLELVCIVGVIVTIRNLLSERPYVLWDWGILIGGALFYALVIVCFRWKHMKKSH